jgi:type VI secretion system protein ImpA
MVDFEELTRPVSADDPCGPDLELSGDIDYMNFVASAEGVLPKSYFGKDQSGVEDRPFDRSSIDINAQFDAAKPFLEKTRDLRLLALLTKFCALDRDLAGFVTCLRAFPALLGAHWDEVHPRGEDGDFAFRAAVLESIDDLPTVIMPLQFLPMIENRRTGPISYRAYAIATGEIKPREDEAGIEIAMIERAMAETDLPVLIDQRRHFEILHDTTQQIRQISRERGGSGGSVSLERLTTLVGKILATLDGAVARRDPSAALAKPSVEARDGQPGGETQAGTTVSVGRVASTADAAAALSAVAEYFSRAEPSNPALLLIRQAQQLVGKSFLEIMRVLVPGHVPQAVINIGKDKFFGLPIEQLSSVVQEYEGVAADPVAEPGNDRDAHSESAAVAGEGNEEAIGSDDATAGADGNNEQAPVVTAAAGPDGSNGPISAAPRYRVNSRSEALGLLEMVGVHFRNAEPSSPIPFLADRARDLALRDFLSVLSALLPEDALKTINPGGGSVD